MENFTGLLAVMAAVLVPLAITFGIVYWMRRKIEKRDLQARETLAQIDARQEHAAWASATIVSLRSSLVRDDGRGVALAGLRLEVQPPGGQPYPASVRWEVELAVLPSLLPGQTIAVKIDTDDPRKVYPNLSGVKYWPWG